VTSTLKVIKSLMRVHTRAKQLKCNRAVRRAIVDAIDTCWREHYTAKRRRPR
jgi:hypothetical protein